MIKIKKATIRTIDGDIFTKRVSLKVKDKEAIEVVRQELTDKFEAKSVNFIYEEIDDEEVSTEEKQ